MTDHDENAAQPRRRRRKALLGAVAATAVAAPMLTTTPADASQGQCTGNWFCIWEDGGFNSDFMMFASTSNISAYSNYNYLRSSKTLNDSVSAVFNKSDHWAKIFQNSNYGGFTLCIAPGNAVSDLHTVKLDPALASLPPSLGNNWGNRVSSHRMSSAKPSGCDTTVDHNNGCSL